MFEWLFIDTEKERLRKENAELRKKVREHEHFECVKELMGLNSVHPQFGRGASAILGG